MARIRSVKPEFFTSRTLAAVSYRARLLFIGLWTHCDDGGRCEDDPTLIRAALFIREPEVSDEDVDSDLDELGSHGLIVRYTGTFRGADRPLLEVCGWSEHQKISHPTVSRIPPPPEDYRRAPEDYRSTTDSSPTGAVDLGTGEQGNRGSRARKRATTLPDDFQVTDEMRASVKGQIRGDRIDLETVKFRDHFRANGKPMKDWTAAWRNWMRRAASFDGNAAPLVAVTEIRPKCPEHTHMTQPCATCQGEINAGLRRNPA